MREIKFRAKSKLKNKWIYANGFYYDGINYWFTTPHSENSAIAWAKHILVISETIGQYTGLKDKNGVEIYEGDILAYSGSPTIRVVAWYKGCWWRLKTDGDYSTPLFEWAHYEEVIGNIYEDLPKCP